uniref:Response regulator receiver protein n=1 Tax=uncultured bacterium contig00021 TaxID=1181511 RepID=A0A806K2S8_9BACT|nr:response regulator receiver protein [uncultured bacterium contig00021]
MEPKYDFYVKNDLKAVDSLVLREFCTIKCPPGYVLPVKKPDKYSLYFVGEGKGVYTLGGKEFPLSESDCFVVYPNTTVKCRADKKNPWTLIAVTFDGAEAQTLLEYSEFSKKVPVQHIQKHILNEVVQLLSSFYRLRGNELFHVIVSTSFLYLLISFFIKNSSFDLTKNPIPLRWAGTVHFNKARDFIEKNYSRDISVEDIAKHVNLSRSRLYRIFLQQTSVSPHQYLTVHRIREACNLLMKRDGSSIKEIAISVGIDNPLYFSTLFKQIMGKSPSEYMKDMPE